MNAKRKVTGTTAYRVRRGSAVRVLGRLTVIVAGLTVALLALRTASAAPGGELDATFGESGRATITFPGGSVGFAGAQQSDGKLLVAGSNQPSGDQYDMAILRLNEDGTLDGTFGDAGMVTVGFFGNDDAYVMFVQPDGKIVAAGATEVSEGAFDVALVRLNADGFTDPTFGSDGRVWLDFGGHDDLAAGAVLVDDDRIVVAGWSNANGDYDVAFARFNADGTLDTTFGTSGQVLVDTGETAHNVAFFLTRHPDGKLVACGMTGPEAFEAENASMQAIRLHADGTLDETFGVGGIVSIDTGSGSASTCTALPDGATMLAGSAGTPGSEDLVLARLTSDGALDTNFGDGGLSGVDFGGAEGVQAMLLLSDGKLGVTGFAADSSSGTPHDLYIARFHADGVLDTTFGNNGVTIVDYGSGDRPADSDGLALIEQADGKLVAVGVVRIDEAFAIARVDPAGAGSTGVVGFVQTSASVREGAANVVLTARRTGGSLGAIDVDVDFVDLTTQSPGDHGGVGTSLSWGDGEMTERTIPIPIIDDDIDEPRELFAVTLSNGSTEGLALAATEAIVTIVDDDAPSGSGGGGGGGVDWAVLAVFLLGVAGRHRRLANTLRGQVRGWPL